MSSPSTTAPLSGGRLAIGTIAVSLAMFMNVLDSSIANVAIPTISGDLGVSVDEGTWVITIFAAANAVSIPLTGWLTQRFGQAPVRHVDPAVRVRVVVVRDRAEPAHAARRTDPAGRGRRAARAAVAGAAARRVAAAEIVERTGAVVDDGARRPDRGPSLGGWITYDYNWSWIFYINIPVGFFAAAVTWIVFRDRESATNACRSIRSACCCSCQGRVAADHARQGQGSRLVQLARRGRARHRRADRLRVLPRVGASRGEPDRRPAAVHAAQFRGRHDRDLGRVRDVLRHAGAAAAVDAGLSRLPRGRFRPPPPPLGVFAILLTPVMGRLLPRTDPRYIATLAFVGFAVVHDAHDLLHRRVALGSRAADAAAGHPDGDVLRAADVDHPVRCRRRRSRPPPACRISAARSAVRWARR